MSHPQFQQIPLECWQHRGRLGLSEPTLCLFHADLDRGREILQALEELEAEGPSSRRLLTFQPSPRNRRIATLRLRLVPPRGELRVLHLAVAGSSATIEMTTAGSTAVRRAVAEWCGGSEDFGVSSRHADVKNSELGLLDKSSGELWFWGPTMEP